MSAAAPSLTPEALPAVTVPGLRTMRLELGERLERGVGARMLVLVDASPSPLRPVISTGDDFLGERSPACGRRGALLRAQRERVLVGARDLEFLGDVLARLRHRIDAVLLLHQRIDEAPADGGVEDLRRCARTPRSALPMTNGARVIDSTPPAMAKLHLAGADGARRGADRFQPRGAQPIDGRARDRSRQARRAEAPCARRCGCPRRPGWRSRERPRRACRPIDLGIDGASVAGSGAPRDRRRAHWPARRRSGRSACARSRR